MRPSGVISLAIAAVLLLSADAQAQDRGFYTRVSAFIEKDRRLVRQGKLQPGAESFFLRGRPGQQPKGRALLLHGFSASPYQARHLARRLQRDGYDVLALRQAGHGCQKNGNQAPEHLPRMREHRRYTRKAEAALDLLASGGKKVHVAGISAGGALSTWLAAYHPDKIAAVELYAPFLAPHKRLHRILARTVVALDRVTFGGVGRILEHVAANKKIRPGSVVAVDPGRPGYRGGETRGQTLAVYKVALEARRGLRELKGGSLPPISVVTTARDRTVSNSVARAKLGRHLGGRSYEYPERMGVNHGMWDANESNSPRASRVINPDLMVGFFDGRPALIDRHVGRGELVVR